MFSKESYQTDSSGSSFSSSSTTNTRKILLPSNITGTPPTNILPTNVITNNNQVVNDSFISMNELIKTVEDHDLPIRSLPTSTFGLNVSSLRSNIEFIDSKHEDLKKMITDNIYTIGDSDLALLFPALYQNVQKKDSGADNIISSRKSTGMLSNFGIVIAFTNYQNNSKFKWRMTKSTSKQTVSSSSSSRTTVSDTSPLSSILKQFNFNFISATDLDRLSSTEKWKIVPPAASSTTKTLKNYAPSRIYLTVTSSNKSQGIRNNNLFFLHISDFGRIAEKLSEEVSSYFEKNRNVTVLPKEGLTVDYQLSTTKTVPSIARFRLLPFQGNHTKQYYEFNILFQLEYVLAAITKSYSSVVIPNSISTYTN